MIDAIDHAIHEVLTPHQRTVLVALALNGVPIDVLADRLGTNRNALYKTLHDARRRLRRHLDDCGLAVDGSREESVMEDRDVKDVLARVLGPAEPEVGCDACFDELDRYVELEAAGADADAAVPGLRAHFAGCPACREEHDSLLALVRGDTGARMTVVREGGCSCGAVRYRLTSEPLFTNCCHCLNCQRQTGSAFVINLLIETDRVELLAGDPQPVDVPRDDGSSQRIFRCPDCQVAVFSEYGRPEVRFVRAGTLDEPSSVTPDAHIFTRTKQSWVELPDSTPAFEVYYDSKTLWPGRKPRTARCSPRLPFRPGGPHVARPSVTPFTPARLRATPMATTTTTRLTRRLTHAGSRADVSRGQSPGHVQLGPAPAYAACGSMFWLRRNTFVGSYSFFSATSLAYVSSP